MTYKAKEAGIKRKILEGIAAVGLLVWLFANVYLVKDMLVDFRGGSDVLLALVLCGVQTAIALCYLAGVRLPGQLFWVLATLCHVAAVVYLGMLYASLAGSVLAVVLLVLTDLLLLVPAGLFIKESRHRQVKWHQSSTKPGIPQR